MWRLQLLWMRWLHAKLIINLPETELASQPIGSLHDTLQMRLNSRVRPLAFHSECQAVGAVGHCKKVVFQPRRNHKQAHPRRLGLVLLPCLIPGG